MGFVYARIQNSPSKEIVLGLELCCFLVQGVGKYAGRVSFPRELCCHLKNVFVYETDQGKRARELYALMASRAGASAVVAGARKAKRI